MDRSNEFVSVPVGRGLKLFHESLTAAHGVMANLLPVQMLEVFDKPLDELLTNVALQAKDYGVSLDQDLIESHIDDIEDELTKEDDGPEVEGDGPDSD